MEEKPKQEQYENEKETKSNKNIKINKSRIRKGRIKTESTKQQ
jgi:hypothetical protein